jgi:hypothetical protein
MPGGNVGLLECWWWMGELKVAAYRSLGREGEADWW